MAADPLTKNTVSDLLNYDVSDDDDPFKDIDRALQVRDDKPTLSPRAVKRKADHDKENDILGLDEEVKITKKRKPIAKLDETRLLSQPGIPKLRALARSGQVTKKLRLKGKGHEFSDAAKLLNYYQLWLDDLYPRAKFADALQLVEKAGHSKRMQTMRKEWIIEGKPGYAREVRYPDGDIHEKVAGEDASLPRDADGGRPESNGGAATAPPPLANQSRFSDDSPEANDDLFFPDTNKKRRADDSDDSDNAMPEEDELDALLAEQQHASRASRPGLAEPETDGDDDLDALLAEQGPTAPDRNRNRGNGADSDEDDDLDALLAEHDATRQANERAKAQQERADDKDDPDAFLEGNESRETLAPGGKVPPSSSPFPIIEDDEESQLVN